MMKATCNFFAPLSVFSFVCLIQSGPADTIYSEDFEDSDGGFMSESNNPLASPAVGEWIFTPGGLGGRSAWSANGGEGGDGGPFEQLLTSPVITIPATGPVTLEFDHLYNFEPTWDGGVVMTRLNNPEGGSDPFLYFSGFSVAGYDDLMQSNNDWGYPDSMNGLQMFGGASGDIVHSVGELGVLEAGDKLEIQFRGGWDWFGIEGPPGWAVDKIELSQVTVGAGVTLSITSLSGNTLQLAVGNLPAGQTFHLRQSVDGEEKFEPTSPVLDITDATSQPISITVDLVANPVLLFQVYEGAAPPP